MSTILQFPDLTAPQLDRFAKLIYEVLGIAISPQKATLLSNRLRRLMRARHVGSYEQYLDVLKRTPVASKEWDEFVDAVTTHETYLFRDVAHWDWLRNEFVPRRVAAQKTSRLPPTLRVWSAACSTGDEAATIACCLLDALPKSGWTIDVLGTDVGAGTVARAQSLTFGERAMRFVEQAYRDRYFSPAAEPAQWVAKPELRKVLRFKQHNLMEPLRERPFDLVVLKNVLIYFDAASKRKVIEHVRQAMTPSSYLITGAAEGVGDLLKNMNSRQSWLHAFAPAS